MQNLSCQNDFYLRENKKSFSYRTLHASLGNRGLEQLLIRNIPGKDYRRSTSRTVFD